MSVFTRDEQTVVFTIVARDDTFTYPAKTVVFEKTAQTLTFYEAKPCGS